MGRNRCHLFVIETKQGKGISTGLCATAVGVLFHSVKYLHLEVNVRKAIENHPQFYHELVL